MNASAADSPEPPEWLSNWASLHGAEIQWRDSSPDLSVAARWIVYKRKIGWRVERAFARTPVQERPMWNHTQHGSLCWSVRCNCDWTVERFLEHIGQRNYLKDFMEFEISQ